MPRCGCSGQCDCAIQGANGIGVTGLGNANDPYRLEFDGAQVAGRGLGWDDANKDLQVRISGSGLGFDSSGALVNTGGGDTGGGDGGVGTWPTVENLVARGQDVIGGQHGGGYLIKPAQLRRSFEYGIERGLDMIHIPVRFLRDGTPVVHVNEFTGFSNFSWDSPNAEPVQEQDIHRWRILPLEPGNWNPRQAWQPEANLDPLNTANWSRAGWHANSARKGWFGYQEENQYGMSTLDDILRLCAGWTCVVINLRWPKRDNITGPFSNATPEYRTNRFLDEVLRLIDKYRMVGSSIVASDQKTIPGGSTTGERSVFEQFYLRGIACGMWLENQGDETKHPADATWDTQASWAFMHGLAAAYKAPDYTAQNIHVVAHSVNRHYEREFINVAGCLGILSGDPEYYAGAIPDNLVHGGFRYRKDKSTFHYDTIDHGLFPPDDKLLGACHNGIRGYQIVGNSDLYLGSQATHSMGDHYVLQGWMCPLSNPTDWALDFWLGWDGAIPASQNDLYMSVAFGLVTDASFQDWKAGTVPSSDPAASGYRFTHGSNGYTSLTGWDGTKILNMAPPVQTANPNDPLHHYRIAVNPRGIRITEWSADGTTLLKEHALVTTTLATAHRGGYIHVSRHAPTGHAAVGRFGNPQYLPGAGTTYGPA